MHVKQETSAIIATFADRHHADYFVNELKRAGFKEDGIEVHYPYGKSEAVEKDAVSGAITGGMVGAAAGAVVTAGLIPGVGPLIAGGILAGVMGGNRSGSNHGRRPRWPRLPRCPGR